MAKSAPSRPKTCDDEAHITLLDCLPDDPLRWANYLAQCPKDALASAGFAAPFVEELLHRVDCPPFMRIAIGDCLRVMNWRLIVNPEVQKALTYIRHLVYNCKPDERGLIHIARIPALQPPNPLRLPIPPLRRGG